MCLTTKLPQFLTYWVQHANTLKNNVQAIRSYVKRTTGHFLLLSGLTITSVLALLKKKQYLTTKCPRCIDCSKFVTFIVKWVSWQKLFVSPWVYHIPEGNRWQTDFCPNSYWISKTVWRISIIRIGNYIVYKTACFYFFFLVLAESHLFAWTLQKEWIIWRCYDMLQIKNIPTINFSFCC